MFKDDYIDIRLTRFFETSAKIMLSMLVSVLLAATLAAILHAAWDLRLVLRAEFHDAFRGGRPRHRRPLFAGRR